MVQTPGSSYSTGVDLATRQRPGLSNAGDHLERTGSARAKEFHPEDDLLLELDMNREYARFGGHVTHNPTNHGGGGATVVYSKQGVKAGKVPGKDGFWSPKTPEGYKVERLVVFIPEWAGTFIRSKMYVFESWGDFKLFFEANHFDFPF